MYSKIKNGLWLLGLVGVVVFFSLIGRGVEGPWLSVAGGAGIGGMLLAAMMELPLAVPEWMSSAKATDWTGLTMRGAVAMTLLVVLNAVVLAVACLIAPAGKWFSTVAEFGPILMTVEFLCTAGMYGGVWAVCVFAVMLLAVLRLGVVAGMTYMLGRQVETLPVGSDENAVITFVMFAVSMVVFGVIAGTTKGRLRKWVKRGDPRASNLMAS